VRADKQRGLSPENNLQRFAIGKLIYEVEQATGSPRYNQISALLDATFLAAERKSPVEIDADNLRMYYTKMFLKIFPMKFSRRTDETAEKAASLPSDSQPKFS
jgi:hypothetical protein